MKKATARRKRKNEGRQTLGQEIIAWIEANCRAPEGALVGRPIRLMEWQKDAISRIYDNPATTRRAIISVGRKSGKTTFAACLLLVHLVGPTAVPNSQLYSCAQSRDQASLLYNLASKIVRLSRTLSDAVVCKDGVKSLVCPERGTVYRALSSEAGTAYGLSPIFCVHDELGVVRSERSELFEALETSTSAQLAPLSIIISTQAESDTALLSQLIDDALAQHDPHTVCILHSAPLGIDPFSIEAIKAANPAFGVHQNPAEVLQMASDAKRLPSREAAFRRLILNQRVEASSPFITPAAWNACSGAPMDLVGRDVVGALDLSSVNDLTCLVLASVDITTGVWHVKPTFWLPEQNLRDKARIDRIPYDLWADRNFLQATPGPVVSFEYVAQYLMEVFQTHRVRKIAYDRWGMNTFRQWLLKAGFTEPQIENVFVGFGQGYQSMSPALHSLESIILEKKLRHAGHPVLTMCMDNAVIERDAAGNRKLSKRRSRGRIDGAVALAMALGVAPLKSAAIDIEALIG